MAKRPEGMDLETWKRERKAHWARINRVLNVLMVLAIGLLLLRYLSD